MNVYLCVYIYILYTYYIDIAKSKAPCKSSLESIHSISCLFDESQILLLKSQLLMVKTWFHGEFWKYYRRLAKVLFTLDGLQTNLVTLW